MIKKYSKKINYYLNMKFNKIIIPDVIMVKDGISCGDRILISIEIDDNIIRFNFGLDNCCDISKSVCNYIEYTYHEKDYNFVISSIEDIVKKSKEDIKFLYDMFELDYQKYFLREECLFSPFEFFLNVLYELKDTNFIYESRPDTISNLACDACVGTCRINWEQKEVVKKDHHKGKKYDTNYLKKWMPFGKVELKEHEIEELKESCKNITVDDLQFLSDFTMNGFVLDHAIKNCKDLIDSKWKAPAYLIQKNEINKSYFEKIKKHISDNKLDIYSVKGYITQKYYDNPMIRVHSDYDLIATNSSDAFKLTNYLLKEGFTIRPNLFSYKEMNKGIISGHFHVQKIIDEMYMFELDITFPGFPINRVDLFFPKVINNDISIEGQIIITLLHLYKHEHVYIKDINDIFYMLKENIDYDYLNSLLKEYRLEKFFNLAVVYIKNNYISFDKYYNILKKHFNLDDNILKLYPDWPYNLEMHLKIKQEDLNDRIEDNKENPRKYLFPVVVFKELFDLNNIISKNKYVINKIEESVYEIKYNDYIFYMTPIGLFIDNYIDTKYTTRIGYMKVLESFLNDIDVKDIFNVSYAYNHFYVRVI